MGIFKKNKTNDVLPNYNKLADNLYINHNEKKISINNKIFEFSDILDAKLIENGFENMLGSTLGKSNYMVGHSKTLINQLDIEIKLDDINNPFFSIKFLKLGIHTGFDRTSKKYKEAYQQAQYCLSILEAIIKNNTKTTN